MSTATGQQYIRFNGLLRVMLEKTGVWGVKCSLGSNRFGGERGERALRTNFQKEKKRKNSRKVATKGKSSSSSLGEYEEQASEPEKKKKTMKKPVSKPASTSVSKKSSEGPPARASRSGT